MNKVILIILFALNSLVGRSHDLGLGVVLIRPSDQVLTLHHHQKVDSMWTSFSDGDFIFHTSLLNGLEAFEEQKTPAIFYFRMLARENGMILIVVNESTEETGWIKETDDLEIMDWLAFLSRFDALQIGIETKLKIAPNDSVAENRQIPCWKFDILQMQGDWVEIESIECELNDNNAKKDRGWVRWVYGKEIVVYSLRNE